MSVTSVSVEQTSPTFFASQTGVMLDGILRIGLQRVADKHNEITDQREGQKDTGTSAYIRERIRSFFKKVFFFSLRPCTKWLATGRLGTTGVENQF